MLQPTKEDEILPEGVESKVSNENIVPNVSEKNLLLSTLSDGTTDRQLVIGGERKVADILNVHETEDTKLLNNEQLQRLVLLMQLKILNVQLNKLNVETVRK